jgi:hypothetical protein
MNIERMTLDEMSYALRTGRASFEDAEWFVATWNAFKVSTRLEVTSVTIDGISTPILLCLDV